MTRPTLAIVGPTASGKTALSLPLAEALRGEIISMDSRQVYRGMDIGTAKASPEERARVPHHGLDVVDPREGYSAARFAAEARGWIEEIRARGHLPLLVGGTGFFLRALTDPLFEEPPLDPDRRDRLRRWMARLPEEELLRWVTVLDPPRSAPERKGGRHRLGRALEVALLTGRPLTSWHRVATAEADPLLPAIVRLRVPRKRLYARIDRRAERMFREGLLAEVRTLLDDGVPLDVSSMTGTGYREAAAVLRGEISEAEAIDRVQRATRRYARRQETWFRHQLPEVDLLHLDADRSLDEQLREVLAWWGGIEGTHGG